MTEEEHDWGAVDANACIERLRTVRTSLETVAPEAPLDDLEPLRRRFEGATVVGLGEASHGTREFFRFKHRLFRFLVAELGLRLFAIEANFAAALDVNRYVTTGEGTAEGTFASDGVHANWWCESVIELLEWMRSFNEGRDPGDRIRFHGLDFQRPRAIGERLASYLDTVDPDIREAVAEPLDAVIGPPRWERGEPELTAYRAALRSLTSRLPETLDEHRDDYVARSDQRAFRRARRLVTLLDRERELLNAADSATYYRRRDETMAANVSWLLDHEDEDRIAIWAHNDHVQRGVEDDYDVPTLGEHLDRFEDVTYVPVGFSFERGRVRIVSVEAEAFVDAEVPAPPDGSLPDALARTDADIAAFDLDSLPDSGPLATWLGGEPRRHSIPGGFDDDPVEYVRSDPRDAFDLVVFVRESTAATGTESARALDGS